MLEGPGVPTAGQGRPDVGVSDAVPRVRQVSVPLVRNAQCRPRRRFRSLRQTQAGIKTEEEASGAVLCLNTRPVWGNRVFIVLCPSTCVEGSATCGNAARANSLFFERSISVLTRI